MIRTEGLCFRHRGAKSSILDGVSVRIPERARAVILGPNGCGKSTLLMCLAGLWKPRSGRILIGGGDSAGLPPKSLAKLMSMVPQSHSPLFSYTVREAVLMGRAPHIPACSSPGREDEEIAMEALAMVGLRELASRPYTQVSGGERQLVLMRIARKLESVFAPKHGSWLDTAEIEFSALSGTGLPERVPAIERLSREAAAWRERRDKSCKGAAWRLTTEDARAKLASLYPKLVA